MVISSKLIDTSTSTKYKVDFRVGLFQLAVVVIIVVLCGSLRQSRLGQT